ncbi:MAG: threonine 3-dehydrogenase [Candidatus Atribacteria bacterium]|nr:threonine 3-dehydrogenase [Candidatus Atribacteria bacterium]
MKALVKTREEKGFELQEMAVPQPGEKEILVKMHRAAICGSDIKIYKWDAFARSIIPSLPFIPGHECAGEVVEVGKGVKNIKVGDKVASETHIPCGQCWQCQHGRPHTCENMQLFGHTINGCFAEYAVIPEVSTRKLPPTLSWEEGCMLEPMGIPYRAAEKGEVEGEAVVVIGCGPIGQFAIGFCHILGAERIIAVDPKEERLRIARSMGADFFINPETESVTKAVQELTVSAGRGPGVVIEASGSVSALREALDYLRVGGRLLILGQSQSPLEIKVSPDIVFKEAQIYGFFGREIWDTWEKTEQLLVSGRMKVDPVITHRFSLEEYQKAFEKALKGEGGKIVFTFS